MYHLDVMCKVKVFPPIVYDWIMCKLCHFAEYQHVFVRTESNTRQRTAQRSRLSLSVETRKIFWGSA